MTAAQAWDRLIYYRREYYDSMSAMYSGNHSELHDTSVDGSFWNRASGKCKIHIPIAADIAATSADLLFSKEPRFTVFHNNTELNEEPQQKRLEYIIRENGFASKLNEAAESAAVLGDDYCIRFYLCCAVNCQIERAM